MVTAKTRKKVKEGLPCPECGSSDTYWEDNEDWEVEGKEGCCGDCQWVGTLFFHRPKNDKIWKKLKTAHMSDFPHHLGFSLEATGKKWNHSDKSINTLSGNMNKKRKLTKSDKVLPVTFILKTRKNGIEKQTTYFHFADKIDEIVFQATEYPEI